MITYGINVEQVDRVTLMFFKALIKIPRTYDALHEHIAKRHTHFLPSFVSVWESLPDRYRIEFCSISPNGREVPPLTSPSAELRSSHVNWLKCRYVWTSWANFVLDVLPMERPHHSMRLVKLIQEKMDHSGSLFELPMEQYDEKTNERELELRGRIAERIACHYINSAIVEATERLTSMIANEGILPLRRVVREIEETSELDRDLDRGSLFDIHRSFGWS